MREVIDEVTIWQSQQEQVALATVVRTWGSSPRKVGAKMALTGEGKIAGSVSGGCVEGAVAEAGSETLRTDAPQLLEFGVADETAWSVGLACGGMIDVFVEPLSAEVRQIAAAWIEEERGGVIATVIRGAASHLGRKLLVTRDSVHGSIDEAVDDAVIAAARTALLSRQPQRQKVANETLELFFDVIMPSPTLLIIGGVHIAQALIEIAQVVGFRSIVVDPRRAFGSTDRFPDVPLIQQWPRKALQQIVINEATAVALLTHDPKIDDQALEGVLPSPAFYIGALGSSRTAAKRIARLQASGFDDDIIGRVQGPIGLDINAQTPEEIALAIMAQIVAAYRKSA